MSIELPDGRAALRTVLTERASGQEHVLFERAGRSCHFALDYIHKEHIVSLRVDWGDLQDGEPTLDADIYENLGGTRGRKLPNREWHHARLAVIAPDELRAYAFKFRDLTLDLVAMESLAASATLSMYVVNERGKPT